MHANDCTRARVLMQLQSFLFPKELREGWRWLVIMYRVLITFGWMQCCDVMSSTLCISASVVLGLWSWSETSRRGEVGMRLE